MQPVIMHHGPDMPPVVVMIVLAFVIFMVLIVTIIKVLLYCKVFSKAGYCWAFGLLVLVPIVSIVMPFILAFGDWPIQKELRALKPQTPGR